jgi:hypothetical protein
MSITVIGVVKDGIVVPNSPLPEGAVVEITADVAQPEIPPELQEEWAGWERGSSEALELVDRMTEEMERNEKR